MTLTQQIITIGLCILGTMTTRFLPFIIFSENRKTALLSSVLQGKKSVINGCSSSTACGM